MRPIEEMTIDDMRAEMHALWAKLDAIPEAVYDEEADEVDRDRFHSLAAALHLRKMEDQTLDGAIYRARGGDAPTTKRVI